VSIASLVLIATMVMIGEHKSSAVSGTIECPCIEFGESDFEVIVKSNKSDTAHDAVRSLLLRHKPLIHSRFEVLLKELNEA
jgi:activator of HSP90 ATPase